MIYISYIIKNYIDEQYTKINDLKEIEQIEGLISYKIIKNKSIIKKLEKNKENYGCYCLSIGG